jgi:C4-dicarboxylate transporter DctM subunit
VVITQTLVLIGILLFMILVIGVPVAFALGCASVIGILIYLSPLFFMQLGNVAFNEATSDNQLIVPLFLLMAEFLSQGKIASSLYEVLSKWMRKIKGGLGIAAVLATTIFAALCGSSPATAAAIGRISVGEMKQRGWDDCLASGLVAAGGTTGIMIPPSITLAVFGIITETSIVKLFMAGVVPGIINSLLFIGYIVAVGVISPHRVGARRRGEPVPAGESHLEKPYAGPDGGKLFLKDLVLIMPPVLLILTIFVFLYTGITTPVEMGAVGSIIALFFVILYGRMKKGLMTAVFKATARTSVMNLMLVVCGLCLSFVLNYLGLTNKMADIITTSFTNK